MSKTYKKKPSEIIDFGDEYTNFCFDEALAQMDILISQDKKPHFDEDRKENEGLKLLMQ